MTFHLEWMNECNVLIDYSFQSNVHTPCDILTNSVPWPKLHTKMKNTWHIHCILFLIQFLFLSKYFIHFSFWTDILSQWERKKNLQFIVFCHCHKSVKRHNRLLIRSKLANWICFSAKQDKIELSRRKKKKQTQYIKLLIANAKKVIAARSRHDYYRIYLFFHEPHPRHLNSNKFHRIHVTHKNKYAIAHRKIYIIKEIVWKLKNKIVGRIIGNNSDNIKMVKHYRYSKTYNSTVY